MTTTESRLGVWSEAGKLRRVLVCAPGKAHQRLTPSNCDALLFDDVLWVDVAKRDHFDFINKLRGKRAEQAATDYDAYRNLIIKGAAAGGTLNATDTQKLERLAEGMGFTLERVEADAVAAARMAELTATPIDVDGHHAAMKAATSSGCTS